MPMAAALLANAICFEAAFFALDLYRFWSTHDLLVKLSMTGWAVDQLLRSLGLRQRPQDPRFDPGCGGCGVSLVETVAGLSRRSRRRSLPQLLRPARASSGLRLQRWGAF